MFLSCRTHEIQASKDTTLHILHVSASRYDSINSAKNFVGKGKSRECGKGRIPSVLLMNRDKVDLEIL